jgi:hypothetical protein
MDGVLLLTAAYNFNLDAVAILPLIAIILNDSELSTFPILSPGIHTTDHVSSGQTPKGYQQAQRR